MRGARGRRSGGRREEEEEEGEETGQGFAPLLGSTTLTLDATMLRRDERDGAAGGGGGGRWCRTKMIGDAIYLFLFFYLVVAADN